MKFAIVMWILTLADLSSEKHIYHGTLDECLLNAILYNNQHEGKKYAGCYIEVKQYDHVPKER